MTTPARPELRPAKLPQGKEEALCPMCLRVFLRNVRGRPMVYCNRVCGDAANAFVTLQRTLVQVDEYATTEGKSGIRSDLWALANVVRVTRGPGNGSFQRRKERQPK